MSNEWGDRTDLESPEMLESAADFQAGRVQDYMGSTGRIRESVRGASRQTRSFYYSHTGGKNLTAALYSHWWYISRNLNYTRVLRNSWKGRLSGLGVQICCLETLLWVGIQFSTAVGKRLFSGPAWGDHISQGTFPFTWVVSAPWKEDSISTEKWHTTYMEHMLASIITQHLQT